jgi:5-methylcytosine-specific restriction enzyme subunit McrC
LNAYLGNLPDEYAECEAILLYPTATATVSAAFRSASHRIRIETINLNQPWPQIEADLLALVA